MNFYYDPKTSVKISQFAENGSNWIMDVHVTMGEKSDLIVNGFRKSGILVQVYDLYD